MSQSAYPVLYERIHKLLSQHRQKPGNNPITMAYILGDKTLFEQGQKYFHDLTIREVLVKLNIHANSVLRNKKYQGKFFTAHKPGDPRPQKDYNKNICYYPSNTPPDNTYTVMLPHHLSPKERTVRVNTPVITKTTAPEPKTVPTPKPEPTSLPVNQVMKLSAKLLSEVAAASATLAELATLIQEQTNE